MNKGGLRISDLLDQYYSPSGIQGTGPSYVSRRQNFMATFDTTRYLDVPNALYDQSIRFSENYWRRPQGDNLFEKAWKSTVPKANWADVRQNVHTGTMKFFEWLNKE